MSHREEIIEMCNIWDCFEISFAIGRILQIRLKLSVMIDVSFVVKNANIKIVEIMFQIIIRVIVV